MYAIVEAVFQEEISKCLCRRASDSLIESWPVKSITMFDICIHRG